MPLSVCTFHTNDDTFIGAFYFTVGNLSPKYRSQISSIYLVALVKTTYIGNYGMDSVLKPIVADVKKLVRIKCYLAVRNKEYYRMYSHAANNTDFKGIQRILLYFALINSL